MIIETDAIVLSTLKFGDTSKIVRLFSAEHGKISVMARGARKNKSKYGSTLEPLSYINISYYQKPNQTLHLLSNAELVIPLRKIQESIDYMTAGLMILESVSQTTDEGEANLELFNLMHQSLKLLNDSKTNPFSIFIYSQIELIRILGFNIDFKSESILPGKEVCISLETGSITNPLHYAKNVFRLSENTFKSLYDISLSSIDDTTKITLDAHSIDVIIDFFQSYISFHTERKFSYRSYNILSGI